MLLLGSRTITIDGITVFPDHADPDQFWYLPGPVQLARSREGRTAFTYIKYKPAAVAGGAKGGGFLMFAVNLRLDADLERRILGKLGSVAPGRPRLAAVPFDEGCVQCIALNLQGAGGTAAQPAGPGSFNAVERILGASVPSLQGDNTAAFSLTLSQEGAIILEKAFEQGTEPVGVIYDLKFTGMRPALKVEITANLERVYNQFSGGLEAQVYFVRAGIDAAFEKLVQDGSIQIKVIDFTGEEDEKEKERWALDFFKENLLRQWFEPTLTPGQVAGGMVQPDSLDNVLRRGNELRPPATPAPPRPSSEPTPPAPPRRSPSSPTAGTGQGESETAGYNVQPGQLAQGASPTENSGFPAASEAVPPAAAVGANVPPSRSANLPASMSGSPNAAGSPALVSFRLRFVRQEERKTVKLVYDRSEATQRTYAPQGFFGLLVADLAKENHFVEVDLDDPFFRVFSVNVEAPIDFQRLGLTSAQIALDYGDSSDPATRKHGDFVFDAQNHEPRQFEVFMNKQLDTTYRYAVQYHFDSLSGWDGSTFSYELPASVTEDRTLLLNPFEHLGFLEVQVVPMRIDWGVVDSIDVHLQHRSANGVTLDKMLTLTQASTPQTWKLRVEDRTARDYTYHCVHHLKDGSTRQSEPITSRASLLPVDDPFPDAIAIEFIPLLDSSRTKMVFIDVEYHDEPNQYHREERLRIMGSDMDPVSLGIAQMNPDLKTFRYRLTVVGANNAIRRDPFIETTETLIAVAD
jgi:hypothetical protein